MNSFHIFTAALATAIALFMGVYFIVYAWKTRAGKLIVFLSVCLISYVVVRFPIVSNHSVASYIVGRFATAMPAALWLLSFHLFTDKRHIPSMAWTIIISHWALRGIGVLMFRSAADLNTLNLALIYGIPQAAMLGLTLHAIYMAVTGYQDDLMENRRNIRVYFVVTIGLLFILILSAGATQTFATSFHNQYINRGTVEGIFASVIFVTIFGFLLMIFRMEFELFAHPVPLGSTRDRVEFKKDRDEKIAQYTINNIVKLMEDEHMYREPGLSIGLLATRLGVKEYQLRRIINKHMRYRNFGQFVNFYRLNEAREKLATTDMPIATIAMDVGYVSLSSFHKAFKDVHGVTPREFRLKHLPSN